ncbi:hypothetical protein LTR28_008073, partial [Elasticomyces elasticus]
MKKPRHGQVTIRSELISQADSLILRTFYEDGPGENRVCSASSYKTANYIWASITST